VADETQALVRIQETLEMSAKKYNRQKIKADVMSMNILPKATTEPARKGGSLSQLGANKSRQQRRSGSARILDTHGSGVVPVRPNLQKKFYEALVMMAVLGRNRGTRLQEEEFEEEFDAEPDPSELGGEKLRRSFLRNLAYLCDFEPGGDSTTAFVLEKTPQGIVYWFASNKGKPKDKDSTKLFAGELLRMLQYSKSSEASGTERMLFEKAVGFSSKRISFYAQLLRHEINNVMDDASGTGSSAGEHSLTNLATYEIL